MAAVRITKDIVWEVVQNIEKIYAPRLSAIDKDNPIVTPDTAYMDAYTLLVPVEAQETMKLLPRDYFRTTNTFRINYRGMPATEMMTLEGKAVPVPHKHSDYTQLSVPETSTWEWFYKPVTARAETRKAVNAEKTSAVDAARAMLGNYATLAPALKAWPALWNLLSEQTKTRHRMPATPREKPAPREIVEVDVSGVTALVTMEKIKGNL